MSGKKIGRPRTGIKPNFTVRIDPAIALKAREAAKASAKRTGLWLEEAILEKIQREAKNDRS